MVRSYATQLDEATESLRATMTAYLGQWNTKDTRKDKPGSSVPRIMPKGKTLYVVQGRSR